ncbi:SidA/IucD/PvdA family monooxygenase [Candidatus Bathyarchaeota archaeon]|nr:SidA/IucD/PvdA family monooxygenase [Candidatus Bathyarchaeota archaeon]
MKLTPPSINAIFNPSFIDHLHTKSRSYRTRFLSEAKATNYSVVRLELIESIYDRMYEQRRELGPDETHWPHRIRGCSHVTGAEPHGDGLRLKVAPLHEGEAEVEMLDVDLVVSATGYRRDAHLEMLRDTWGLLPAASPKDKGDGWEVTTPDEEKRRLEAGRDYGVRFGEGMVQEGSGVWLQGCCETTHGVSFYLFPPLPFLSTRFANFWCS